MLKNGSQNGRNLQWFDNIEALKDAKALRGIKIERYIGISSFSSWSL
jgi:hypothetical protein